MHCGLISSRGGEVGQIINVSRAKRWGKQKDMGEITLKCNKYIKVIRY